MVTAVQIHNIGQSCVYLPSPPQTLSSHVLPLVKDTERTQSQDTSGNLGCLNVGSRWNQLREY